MRYLRFSYSYLVLIYCGNSLVLHGYRHGLKGLLLQYAMKKYKGHRTINDALDKQVNGKQFVAEEENKLNAEWKKCCELKVNRKCK